jgi:hypothetical protein
MARHCISPRHVPCFNTAMELPSALILVEKITFCQSQRIDEAQRISTHIRVSIYSTGEFNRVARHIAPRPRIIIPVVVVMYWRSNMSAPHSSMPANSGSLSSRAPHGNVDPGVICGHRVKLL